MWPTGCFRRSITATSQRSTGCGGDHHTPTAQRHYEILDRQQFCGSIGGFVQQHILRATGHAGQLISMRVWIVLKVDPDGLINRIDEYFDLAEIAPHDGLARATEKME
jgi:hypothetical protein